MPKQEEFHNRILAQLLSEHGVAADYEDRRGRRKLDVVADVDGLEVVLEAETGFESKAQAIKDADARLRQNLAIVAFAVCYPDGVTEDTLASAELTWTVRTKPGEPSGEWSEGGVAQLAQAVQQAPHSLSGTDVAARMLSDGLDQVVQMLKPSVWQALAQTLDLPATKPKKGRQPTNRYFVAAKRSMLVVATAMLFHHRVQEHLPVLCPTGYDGPWPPASAGQCTESDAPRSAFREAWQGILAVDYRPVFETGRVALGTLPADLNTGQAVSQLAEVVARVSERVVGLRHDLLGRIFHRVLDTARYDGSFYTSTAAAVLLALLALREQDADWSNADAIGGLRICDPACGTGTLLMAAAERIRDLRNAAGRSDPEDDAALGLLLVEDVLWGYDVNLTATHMAASTLGMLSPTTRFTHMNIHRALLGVFDGEPYLGSLDFLSGQIRQAPWPSVTRQVDSDDGAAGLPQPMDLVIMNPPFTRDSLRHDQFSKADESALKRSEKEVFADRPTYMAGNSGAFLVLGEHLNRADTGALAAVLPLMGMTDKSGREMRRFLASRYHIDTIIASHDPQRIFFSENTSIGEVLLVCRRWDGSGSKPPTRVVNLARNPETPLEALDAVTRIERLTKAGDRMSHDLTIQWADAGRIAVGDWYAVNFLSPFLVDAYRTLTEANPGTVPAVPLRHLAEIGPEGRRVRDSYHHSALPSESGRRALWFHKTDITQSMLAETDVYIEPKVSKRHLADRYWEQRGELLLPHRLRLNLARVAAVMLPEPSLGSRWTPCRPHDPNIAKALCLYLNSTPGILTLLGGRDNKVPSYPSFSLDTLRSLSVPDFAALEPESRDYLTSWFDWLRDAELLPLPLMHEDPVRRQIDDAVTDALGLDPEWIATVRRELAREPAVMDRRRE